MLIFMNKTLRKITFFFLISLLTTANAAQAEPAKLRYSLDFLIEKTLQKKNQTARADVPLPKFFFASTTNLSQFQDALEKQWGFRPDVFTNAFAVESNEIYIMDDEEYYRRHGRCMDDSIVHELVHYIQVKYLNWDLYDESLEWDAVEVQTLFREEYCKPSVPYALKK